MDTRTKLLLSEWAYAPDPARLPAGLELLTKAETASGYQGYAIGRRDPANPRNFSEVVLVSRGSDVTTKAAHEIPGEATRDLSTDIDLLAGVRHLPLLDDATAFYRDVERNYGSRSATPVQLTGHSLGGACAYIQFASAVEANQQRLPVLESFAAPDPSLYIRQAFPHADAASFATSINHVRANDPLVGPRPVLFPPALAHMPVHDRLTPPLQISNGLPRLGINHVLPKEPHDLLDMLKPHDTTSLEKEFSAGEIWRVRDGRLDMARETLPVPQHQAALLQSSVASR
ncbi:hypothetical protein [Roseiterribacter gracilis]|uniref:Uncharacterized protein n=1 Tax=Roseiterribacter gracilis TaxID=2812848 RepID=A0A8S8X7T5_9PROT|nr:hypothetical protein TMPK1_08110 [Rhodospirillales bacterium TMPK1]